MLRPDGYEGGAPYWILPSGRKTYDAYKAHKAYEEYFKNKKRRVCLKNIKFAKM